VLRNGTHARDSEFTLETRCRFGCECREMELTLEFRNLRSRLDADSAVSVEKWNSRLRFGIHARDSMPTRGECQQMELMLETRCQLGCECQEMELTLEIRNSHSRLDVDSGVSAKKWNSRLRFGIHTRDSMPTRSECRQTKFTLETRCRFRVLRIGIRDCRGLAVFT